MHARIQKLPKIAKAHTKGTTSLVLLLWLNLDFFLKLQAEFNYGGKNIISHK